MGEGWRKSKKLKHPEKDSPGKRFKRLWDIDNWLLEVVWEELPEDSEIRLKIAAYDDALEVR